MIVYCECCGTELDAGETVIGTYTVVCQECFNMLSDVGWLAERDQYDLMWFPPLERPHFGRAEDQEGGYRGVL